MAATTQIARYSGAAGSMVYTGLDTSTNKANFSRDDSNTGTTAVPIPTSAGTKYSFMCWIGLGISTGAATSISNRAIYLSSAPASGLHVWYGIATGTYTQQNGTQGTGAANYPADNATTDGATPSYNGSSCTAMPTSAGSAFTYDATSHTATANNTSGSNGATAGNFLPNGNFEQLVFGVDSTFVFSANPTALPNINLQYQEQ